MNKIINSGVILEDHNQEDWVCGGISGSTMPVLFPDGHGWLKYQRPEETQRNRNFDSYSCVSFGCLKSLSYYMKVVHGLDMNFSERFTAVMSGTTPGQGNSVRNVLESIRKDGFVLESDYPSMTPDMTENEWYQQPPESVKKKALDNLKNWKIEWETLSIANPFTGEVSHDQIIEGQKKGVPITIGYAWLENGLEVDGIGVYVTGGNPANHCFTSPDHKDNHQVVDLLVDDSYPRDFGIEKEPDQNYLKYLHKGYSICSAHIISAQPIGKPTNFVTLIKNMIKNLWYYWDQQGLHAFFINRDKNDKPISRESIDFKDPVNAVTKLYVAMSQSGLLKQSSWPEVSSIPEKK